LNRKETLVIPRKTVALPIALALIVAGCAADSGEGGAAETEQEAAPEASSEPNLHPVVVLETSMGTIAMELDRENSPKSVANFLAHVGAGFYDGLIFHRILGSPKVIQAGLLTADYAPRRMAAAFVENEGANGLLNVRGSVAMARGSDPHSAKSEFFINVGDNAQLDTSEEKWGWAVFGKVIEGMEVVEAIADLPTRSRGTREYVPEEPLPVIERCYVRQ
jgi:peptidyl-prolyl cis-trans isomerase A (cyclophilin A)